MEDGVEGFAVNLSELAAALNAKNERERPARHPLDQIAQAMELASRFADASNEHVMRPGDLVQSKSGLGFMKSAKTVMILWRMLDPNDPLDMTMAKRSVRRTMVNRVDCIVGFLSDDGSTVHHMPAELALLEPYVAETPKRLRTITIE